MIASQNVTAPKQLSNAARTKFLQWSTWAATQAATGNMTADRALRKAVRELARGGLSIASVTYRDEITGKVTVTNKADVAVQRHIRSLIAQGAAQLTLERMRENGVEFVEVSSHLGSRPSHAEWHGRVYHIGGAVEIDGVRYEDFAFGTGYGGECGPYTALGDRLLGVNCRHSFGPWVPGGPRAYSPDPESPSGLPNEEIYRLTQGQRARERKIREAKRELSAAQVLYDADPSPENAANLADAKNLLRRRQEAMRGYIRDANAKCRPGTQVLVRQPNREWAGDMPNGAPMKTIRENLKASSGLSEQMWLRQFEDEVLTAKLPDGSTFSKTGTPMGVALTPQEAAQLHGAELTHTHTTTIGGTFSWEDIELTVVTASPRHTVKATIEKRWYELVRTPAATNESADMLYRDFLIKEECTRDDAQYQIWKDEYESAGIGLDDAGRRKALSVVKSEMHNWLKEHAKEYGFSYASGRLS